MILTIIDECTGYSSQPKQECGSDYIQKYKF